jgi:hypothetical protein
MGLVKLLMMWILVLMILKAMGAKGHVRGLLLVLMFILMVMVEMLLNREQSQQQRFVARV